MKKLAVLVLTAFLVLGCLSGCAGGEDKIDLYVYNWGEYISDGTDDTLDVIAAFEDKYPNITVHYSTYPDNESMYSRLSNGGITVDVIIPSDYMITRMIQEDMLLELNFDNIPNFQYIDDSFKNPDYDPENKYSVPYTWGTVGIVYNTKYVDPADVTGWELMWNEKYAGEILMFGNSRDAFGIAEYLLGYSVNTTDEAELRAAAAKLNEQKPLVQQYVMDEIFDAMENGEAYIAAYYAGDCYMMMQENPDLDFFFPETQGFNLFTDAMCIPKCAAEKEAAELFINFLCDPEICGANLGSLGYCTPSTASREFIDPEMAESPIAYPSEEVLSHGTVFAYLPEETTRLMEELFMQVRGS